MKIMDFMEVQQEIECPFHHQAGTFKKTCLCGDVEFRGLLGSREI